MNETSKTIKVNPNGEAIANVLREHKGEVLAFAEIAKLANIEPKTGYLTAAKKLAKIEKVVDGVTVKVETKMVYPSGLEIVSTKETTIDGYTLAE